MPSILLEIFKAKDKEKEVNKLADYFNSSAARKAVCIGALALGSASIASGFYSVAQGAVASGLLAGVFCGSIGVAAGVQGLRKLPSSRTP